MIKPFSSWYNRNFNDPEIVSLLALLIGVILAFFVFHEIIMPILASIVIAYLLEWFVQKLEKLHVPHGLAVTIVFLCFMTLVVISLLGLLPILWRQLTNLVNELPKTLGSGQQFLADLPARYPTFISHDQITQMLTELKSEGTRFGQFILSISLASIPSVIAVIVYLVLVPLLVYFFMMDKKIILRWLERYLPSHKRLICNVWNEVHSQIGNYVGGKFVEIILVWFVTYMVFLFMGLQYAMLLSTLVGLSALVPYIGTVVVTVPVVLIAFFQWGWNPKFAYLVIAYSLIVILDANVLVPFLFSGMVALHPVVIIIATLFFGSLWGFWGVFFAIPLAILAKALLKNLQAKKTAYLK